MKKCNRIISSLMLSLLLSLTIFAPLRVQAEDQVTSFVTRLYQLCLDREPDAGGLRNWTNALKAHTHTASQVVQGFFESKEMLNRNLPDSEYIDRCYRVMLNREPDESGKQTWMNARADGASYDYILHGFTGSQEFMKLCKSYGIECGSIDFSEFRDMNLSLTQFVQRLYANVLGRTADIGGLNYWCGRIITKLKTPKYVATTGFFHSQEYLGKKTDNNTFVVTCYKTFLNRDYDQGGYDYWMKRLANGESRDVILAGFADSTEFAGIIEKSGWQATSAAYLNKEFSNVNSMLLLANKKHRLPSGYQPSDLRVPNTRANQTIYLRDEAATQLEKMFNAAAASGVYLVAGSGFRSESLQSSLYYGYVNSYGQAAADGISSRPGYSDHQTGLAIDISDNSGATYLTTEFEGTAEGVWLKNHAHEYGYIMRYPKGKSSVTGYNYEPWHFRYVGVDYATAIYSVDVWNTFEEYFGVEGGDYR